MIGFFPFLFELGTVFVPLLFVFGGIAEWRSTKRRQHLLIVVLSALMWLFFVNRFVAETRNYLFLTRLAPDQIVSIKVAGKEFNGKDEVTRIAKSLNEAQWFASNHGGWAQGVPVTVKLKMADDKSFMVSYYPYREGAVIEFYRGSYYGANTFDGYAFCRGLPQTLQSLGAPLPDMPR